MGGGGAGKGAGSGVPLSPDVCLALTPRPGHPWLLCVGSLGVSQRLPSRVLWALSIQCSVSPRLPPTPGECAFHSDSLLGVPSDFLRVLPAPHSAPTRPLSPAHRFPSFPLMLCLLFHSCASPHGPVSLQGAAGISEGPVGMLVDVRAAAPAHSRSGRAGCPVQALVKGMEQSHVFSRACLL